MAQPFFLRGSEKSHAEIAALCLQAWEKGLMLIRPSRPVPSPSCHPSAAAPPRSDPEPVTVS